MRMHRTTLLVIDALLSTGANGRLYGLEIMDTTGIKSGTLYPILDRLETAGWIEGAWGEETGHPRRRYYSLTGLGRQEIAAIPRASFARIGRAAPA